MIFDDIETKILSGEAYVSNSIEEYRTLHPEEFLPTSGGLGEEKILASTAVYETAFSKLRSAINTYRYTANASVVAETITSLYSNQLVTNDAVIDMLPYYYAFGKLNDIVQEGDEYWWEGMFTVDTQVTAFTSVFTDPILLYAESAEGVRRGIISQLNSVLANQALRVMFTDYELVTNAYTKTQFKTKIYVESGISEIIRTYGLSVYIPEGV